MPGKICTLESSAPQILLDEMQILPCYRDKFPGLGLNYQPCCMIWPTRIAFDTALRKFHILARPVRRKITQDRKIFSHSKWSTKYRGKKHFLQACLRYIRERNTETPKNLSIDISVYTNSRSFNYANTTIPAKGSAYFRRVSCGFPLHFVLCLELFSSRKTHGQLMAGNWRVCIFRVGKHETTPSVIALLLGRKKQRFSGAKPELLRPFGTGPWKHCPQGILLSFLTFLRPNFFNARLDFSPPRLTAPGSPRMRWWWLIRSYFYLCQDGLNLVVTLFSLAYWFMLLFIMFCPAFSTIDTIFWLLYQSDHWSVYLRCQYYHSLLLSLLPYKVHNQVHQFQILLLPGQ